MNAPVRSSRPALTIAGGALAAAGLGLAVYFLLLGAVVLIVLTLALFGAAYLTMRWMRSRL